MLVQDMGILHDLCYSSILEDETEFTVNRWHNGREKGYVLTMKTPFPNRKYYHVIFSNNRNSDDIRVMFFKTKTLNPITAEDIPDRVWDSSKFFAYNQIVEVADFIEAHLRKEWLYN